MSTSSEEPPALTFSRSVSRMLKISWMRASRWAWVWEALSPNRFARVLTGMRGVLVIGPPVEEHVGGLSGGM